MALQMRKEVNRQNSHRDTRIAHRVRRFT